MKKGDYLFGMRPECIFLNTQLGDKNPFLRHATTEVSSYSAAGPRTRLCDATRDYESYPDIYWKLRSETVGHPEDLEHEMIDRDLYRLQQATALKLTTFDKSLLNEPFRNWRSKAGDLLLFPLGSSPNPRKKKVRAFRDLVSDPPMKTTEYLKSESNIPMMLEVQATPIRKNESCKRLDSHNLRTAEKCDEELVDGNVNSPNSDSDKLNCKNSKSIKDDDNLLCEMEINNAEGKILESRKFSPTEPSVHTSNVSKELIKPSVISVQLELGNIRDKFKRSASRNLSINDSVNTECYGDNQSHEKAQRDLSNSAQQRNTKLILQRSSNKRNKGLATSFTQENDSNSIDTKTEETGVSRSPNSVGNSSAKPLKAVYLEVFNERNQHHAPKIYLSADSSETSAYKLDMLHYPPARRSHMSLSAKAGSHIDRLGWTTSRSGVKKSKPLRKSRSATNSCLTITQYF